MPVTLDIDKIRPPRNGGSVRTPWFDHLSDHPANGLTPSKLTELLRRAETGDLTAQAELYEDIADRDPSLVGAFETRKLSVLSKPWEIIPVDDSGRAGKKQAAARRAMLENLSQDYFVAQPGFAAEYLDFESLCSYLLDATARGFAAAVPVWDPRTWTLVAAKQIAQKHFIGADITKMGTDAYNPYELRLRTVDNYAIGETLLPYQFVIHWYRGKPGVPARMGLLRTLTWWYLFKNFAIKSWVKAAERFGMPLVLGRYDDTASESDIAALKDAVKGLGIDGGAVTSIKNQLEIIEAKGGNITGDIWSSLTHACDIAFAKVVLGHASTTESVPGKLGAEDQALQVQSYRLESDARALERTINQQIIAPVNRFVEGTDLCYFKIRYEAEEDVNARTDRFVKLVTAGIAVPRSHVYETLDIPAPADGEEVFSGVASDPFAAALGGAIGASNRTAGTRQFANARIFDNASPARTRTQRLRRKQRAIAETDDLEKSYAAKLTQAYAVLVDGLPADDTAPDAVLEAAEDFRAAFSPVVRDMIESAMNISARELMVADLWDGARIANKINPFEVRNLSALDWLDFQALVLTEIETETITLALASRIKDELINFAQSGLTPKQFYDRVLDAEGIGTIGRGHLQTVLRTNIATARSSATEIAVQRNPGAFPAWQYIAIIDDRTRDDHAALDGQVFPMADKRYWPPLGYNCRCEASPVHEAEMAEEQYELASSSVQGVDVPRGFGADTRVNYARWVDKVKRENETIRQRIESLTQ